MPECVHSCSCSAWLVHLKLFDAMEKTTVIIDMDRESLQQATTAVIEHLALYPPSVEEQTINFSLGMQVLFDCLRPTFGK